MCMLAYFGGTGDICNMIKGNELNVGNTDFELQAKKGDKS